jgi:amino-acid N-acetyltransferase
VTPVGGIGAVTVRRARRLDALPIAELVNRYAARGLMLPRTTEQVALAVDDYVVAADWRGRVLACGALHEYSPSVAEVSSIAVAPDQQRGGLGRAVVEHVEALARTRGYDEVFLVTVWPEFFASLGYAVVDDALYPEKICPHAVSLPHCAACDKVCMWRALRPAALEAAA